ncbi:MAG TPA: hypothetical protein VFF40_01540 [Acidimicrobiia bacterium]|nr:hypothetical protein [Acidimicrobiia bacterium]
MELRLETERAGHGLRKGGHCLTAGGEANPDGAPPSPRAEGADTTQPRGERTRAGDRFEL